MKAKLNNGLAFLMAFMLLANVLAILPVAAAPAFEVYMVDAANDLDTDTHSIGYEWDIVLWVTDIPSPGAFAFNLKLFFNPSWLSCVGANLPDPTDTTYIFYGKSSVRPSPSIDNTLGTILFGDTLFAGQTPTQGAGPYKLGIFRLRVDDKPDKYGELYSDLNINNVDTYFLDEGMGELPGLIKTDGYVRFTWLPPPYDPNLAIRPEALTFDQYTNWTHPATTFDVDVKIEDLHVAWALHNASVTVTYNTPEVILELVNAVMDPDWTLVYEEAIPGQYRIDVENHPAPIGDITIVTLTFKIIHQGVNPPQTDANVSDLILASYTLWDTYGTIPTDPRVDGKVIVEPLLTLPLPWFEVEPPDTVLGPDLVVGDQFGKEFEVDVNIENLHGQWKMMGWQIRLTYDPDLLDVVSVTEGPFLKDPLWAWYGTYFVPPIVETNNIVMGCMLFPNASGKWDRFPGLWNPSLVVENLTAIEPAHMVASQWWHETYPAPSTMYHEEDYIDSDHDGLYSVCDYIKLDGYWYHIVGVERPSGTHVKLHLKQEPVIVGGTLVTITFAPIRQSWTIDYFCDLEILPLYGDSYLLGYKPDTDEIVDILVDEGKIVDGTVTVLHLTAIGRRIDVWMQYPFPYGGQGLDQPADLVVPQQLVCLTAKVTYNWWPVEGKLVQFAIFDNQGVLYGSLSDITDADGHATVCFRMPWPGEDLFGVWTIIACVEVAEVIVCDTMTFHYDYLVQIWKITTDEPEYAHLDTVTVTVEYGTHAQQFYTTWMDVAITDDLGVIIDNIMVKLTVGGAEYCEYEDFATTVVLQIPHWAYAGLATVHVNFLDATGSAPVTPEATKTIWIMPI